MSDSVFSSPDFEFDGFSVDMCRSMIAMCDVSFDNYYNFKTTGWLIRFLLFKIVHIYFFISLFPCGLVPTLNISKVRLVLMVNRISDHSVNHSFPIYSFVFVVFCILQITILLMYQQSVLVVTGAINRKSLSK